MHTHTHTHIHPTCTHTCIHTHITHACIHTHTHTHIHTHHTHMHTHAYTHTSHMHTHHTRTCIHITHITLKRMHTLTQKLFQTMDETTTTPTLVGCSALEQFLLLAKTAKGPAAVELIKQALEAPGVYVFGELLETDCVKELVSTPSANYVRLLEVFAYGTYTDYICKLHTVAGC